MTTVTDVATEQSGLHPTAAGERVTLRMAAAGVVRATHVDMTNAGAGLIFAGESASLDRAGARTIVSAGPLTMDRAGAALLVTAGDAAITRGGLPSLVALGSVTIEQSGAGMVLTRRASVGRGGFIGLALSPSMRVEPGGRVLAGLREVAAMGVVALCVTALVFALSRWTGRRG